VKLKFKEPRTWRYIIGSIEKIIDEGVFTANDNGLHFRALDTSRIVMVDFIYPKSSFDEFEVNNEESIGVSFSVLSDVLKRAEKDDMLELITDENNIALKYIGKGERIFRIPQLSLSQDKLPEPKITFTVRAKLTNNSFIDIINDIEAISDSLTISANDKEDKLIITGRGDIESAEIELSLEKQNIIELNIDSPDSSTYSIEYFSNMLIAAKEADLVTLMYSQDAPVKVEMEYQNGGKITFYVSPRID